jgi:stage V sporulation protein B
MSQPDSNASQHAEPASKGVIFLTLAGVCAALAGYAMHVVGARCLPQASYGQFVVAISILTWCRTIQQTFILPGLYKAVSEDHRRLAAALSLAARWWTPLTLGLAVILAIGGPWIGQAFRDPGLSSPLIIAAIEIPFAGMMTLGHTFLNSIRRYRAVAAITSLFSLARSAAACLLLALGFGVSGGMVGSAAGAAIAGCLALVLLLGALRKMERTDDPSLLRRSIIWSGAAAPFAVSMSTLMSLDLWLVKGLLEETDAGVYGAAFALSRLPHFLVVGLITAVYPRVSNALGQQEVQLARSVSREAVRVLLIVILPICFLIGGSASELIEFFFTDRFSQAAGPLVILMAALGFQGFLNLFLALIAAADHPVIRLAATILTLAVGAALGFWLTPQYGIQGAAWAMLITFGIGALMAWAAAFYYVRFVPPVWTIIRCTVAGAAVFGLSLLWAAPGWLILVKLPVLGVVYGLILVVSRELGVKDLRLATGALRP